MIDFVHSHKVFVQTDGAEFVLQAEAFEGARNAAFAENFRNRAAEAADDAVVFNGDDTAGFFCCLQDSVLVDRLDGVHVENSCRDVVVCFQNFCSLNSLIYAGTASDQSDVVAFDHFDCFAHFEAVVVGVVNDHVETAVDTDIERTRGVCRGANRKTGFDAVCRADKSHVDEAADCSEVFDGVVGGTCLTEGSAAVGADDFNVYVLIANVGVNLIQSPQRGENAEGRSERNKTAFCHTCGDADKVLFRNTDVEESLREFCFEVADFGGAGKVGRQSDYVRIFFAEFDESSAVNFSSCEFRGLIGCISKSACHDYLPSFSALAMRSERCFSMSALTMSYLAWSSAP